jgi:hypothetical protein
VADGCDVPDEPVVDGVVVPGLSFFIMVSDFFIESDFFMPSADAMLETPAINPAARTALKIFEFIMRSPFVLDAGNQRPLFVIVPCITQFHANLSIHRELPKPNSRQH